MRSVRCDSCGTKALLAASQCPKCGHLFDVRDGFGELLPLAFCPTCESYYPESQGECRWCGTKPQPAPIAPRIWRGAGIGALVMLIGATWLLRESRVERADAARAAKHTSKTRVAPADTLASSGAIDAPDSAPLPKAIATANSDRVRPSSLPDSADVTPTGTTQPPATVSAAPQPTLVEVPPPTPPTPPAAARRTSAQWVTSISKGWVVVRAGPDKGTRLVASIGPNSRVQLGEARGAWRRVRARGFSGWVESSSIFNAPRSSTRTRTASVR